MEISKIVAFESEPRVRYPLLRAGGPRIYKVRISDFAETQARATTNLLLIEQDGWKHNTWIKNMNPLCLKEISEREHQVKICCRSMQHLGDQAKQDGHLQTCCKHKTERYDREEYLQAFQEPTV